MSAPGVQNCETSNVIDRISQDSNNPTILPWAQPCEIPEYNLWKTRTDYGYDIHVAGPLSYVIKVVLTCGPPHAYIESEIKSVYNVFFNLSPGSAALIARLTTNPEGGIDYRNEYEISFGNGNDYDRLLVFSYTVSLQQQITGNSNSTQVTVTPSTISFNNICTSCRNIEINDNDQMQEIPVITVTLQSDIRGINMGEAAFNVYDSVSYCTEYPCNKEQKCCKNVMEEKTTNFCPIVTIPWNKTKLTKYSQYPPLQEVLRGKGCTLKEKATSIKDDPNLTLNQFILRLMTYGMLKYILARLITGEFNLKWLLYKNNREFFIKLENSRLCRFIEAFNSPEIRGYNKYFK